VHREGGIWAPQGPSVDAAGNVYVATGNGDASTFDYGDAVIKLSAGMRAAGYFAPKNSGALNDADADLGSNGPMLLPGGKLFEIGKSGVAYLLDTAKLGGIGHALASLDLGCGSFGGLAYANGTVYVPCGGGLTAVTVTGSSLRQSWTQPAVTQPPILAGPGLWGVGGDMLYELDPATGAVRYHAKIGDTDHFATPSAAGGRVFVAAGGRVFAFG